MKKLNLIFLLVVFLLVMPLSVKAQTLDDIASSSSEVTNDDNDDNAVANYLENYEQITSDNMQAATAGVSPIVNILGILAGFIVMIVQAGIVVVTALDLCYIGLPFTREMLTREKQFVSDDAIAVVPKPNMQMGAGMMPHAPGQGGMGMPPMGAPMGAPQQQKPVKMAIAEYFKKRVFFILIFTIATIILTSSVLTGCGVNLAGLLLRLLGKFNLMIS